MGRNHFTDEEVEARGAGAYSTASGQAGELVPRGGAEPAIEPGNFSPSTCRQA